MLVAFSLIWVFWISIVFHICVYVLQSHRIISDKIAFIFKLFSPGEAAKKSCFRPKLPEVSCVQAVGSPLNRWGFHLIAVELYQTRKLLI